MAGGKTYRVASAADVSFESNVARSLDESHGWGARLRNISLFAQAERDVQVRRNRFTWLVAVPLWVFAILLVAGRTPANVFINPPYSVDALLIVEGARDLMSGAQAEGMVPQTDGTGVTLAPEVTTGVLTLGERRLRFPFNEAIPSWNATTPPGTGLRVWMRVGSRRAWTDWFEAGSWGIATDLGTTRVFDLGVGRYEYDSLLLREPADRVQVRVELVRQHGGQSAPTLRLFALSYSNTLGDEKLFRSFGKAKRATRTAIDERATTLLLPVKFRSQVIANTKWIGRICAPASAAMAATAFGVDLPTQELAAQIYDPVSDMFGVWHRVVQGVAQSELRGYITRFRHWDDVLEELKRGSVILCSIRFKHGEIPNPPRIYRRRGTEGHIVVLVGVTPRGTLLVHDSASKDWGQYNEWTPEQLAKAWFDKGGVAMVFTRPEAGTKSVSRSQGKPQTGRR
ncbi:MAG: C39 family peptidase [Candidatus Sumerlaea chitinivorans]|jgi:hypothetical protein|nr:C39 family peptidase [Candidatus Sumerlaea chitinivorans]